MNKESIEIKEPYTEKDLIALKKHQHIEELSLINQNLVTAKIAQGISL